MLQMFMFFDKQKKTITVKFFIWILIFKANLINDQN